ncbi:MAG: inorganic phosphate transporter [Schlesneria sp.]
METTFWEAFGQLSLAHQIGFAFALFVAFGFEFINGFHDTANAVTTVIYTGTLKPTPAVVFSGFLNFLGVLLGGTAVAFAIVNLLPVDLLIDSSSMRAIVMVLSLLLAGVIWNLGTWWMGLPVSSSHTLIGSIIGVGMANSLMTIGNPLAGINWPQVRWVGMALLISPIIGFVSATLMLWAMKRVFKNPNLYHPPGEGDEPPHWIRGVLLATCGGVSFAHGSNDGQKGMGLILLVLIGFLPTYYALDVHHADLAVNMRDAAISISDIMEKEHPDQAAAINANLAPVVSMLDGKRSFSEVSPEERWQVRQAIYRFRKSVVDREISPQTIHAIDPYRKHFSRSIEFVPFWVVVGVALALGIGTMIGYQRIVVTIAEKIGKTHLTYAQGASAEVVAAATIMLADAFHLPVSTTHVLSSGIAGTMYANQSGLQTATLKKIALAWVLTLPASILLSATLFIIGGYLIPGARAMSPAFVGS